MSRDYSTVDAVFEKNKLFSEFCEATAQEVAEAYLDHQEDDETGTWLDFTDAFDTLYDESFEGMLCCEAEDYINSYGIFPALEAYQKEFGDYPLHPHSLLILIARERVFDRAYHLVEKAQEEEEDEEEEEKNPCPDCQYCKQPKTWDNTRYIKSHTFTNKDACVSCYEASDDGYEWGMMSNEAQKEDEDE